MPIFRVSGSGPGLTGKYPTQRKPHRPAETLLTPWQLGLQHEQVLLNVTGFWPLIPCARKSLSTDAPLA